MNKAEDYLDEKFPKEVYYKGVKKPESKLRGEALVLFAVSKLEERDRILKLIDEMDTEKFIGEYCFKAQSFKKELKNAILQQSEVKE